jgi:aspartyl-tRNA(Asn)/glutamyl-tRNA(Gln) amidotransferase subunit A
LTIKQLNEEFKAKKLSPVEYAKDTIAALKQEPYNCINAYDEESILEAARKSEARYQNGESIGVMDGVPVGIKDMIDTEGLQTTYGCGAYVGNKPEKDAFIVTALKKAGAITGIKTNTSQFALGPTGEFCLNGAVRNPVNPEYYTGGSSSGSVAAVKGGLVPCAVGTDTGGSIRTPSSFTGVVGMKTTYSLISNEGIQPCSDAFDVVGPITTTVEDNAILLNELTAYNNRDWRQSYPPGIDYLSEMKSGKKNYKLALIRNFFEGTVDPDVTRVCNEVVSDLEALGMQKKDVMIPDWSEHKLAHQKQMLCYTHYVHDHDISWNSAYIYPQVMRRLHAGILTSDEYVKHDDQRRYVAGMVLDLMGDADCLCYPTSPVTAGKIGEGETRIQLAGKDVSLYELSGAYAWIGNYTGMPSISIPVGISKEGLPIGLALLGRYHSEALLYAIADRIMKNLI